MAGLQSLSQVKQAMHQHQFHPRKKWGQNFLVDRNITNKIIEACMPIDGQFVVEIGPGLGALTGTLAERSLGVLAVEIDRSFEPVLSELTREHNNARLLFADVLAIDIESELTRAFTLKEVPPFMVCANIPYNITSPILFKLLEQCTRLTAATLMIQKEVAQRIVAGPGSKTYGLLSITAGYYARIEYVMTVSRHCFYPEPEVDSSVIRIIPREIKPEVYDEKLFKGLLKAAFQKRRKTILNICTSFFPQEKAEVEHRLKNIDIDPGARPENLSMEEFVALANHFAREG
ncbi:MAG: 16S rRNA (adenine(1518)-N(6)/adenine(1519)-N(6))-dimethyltransferase RsmA [Deltaproteobacteria bacterium]